MALHIAKRLLRTRATTPTVALFSAVDRSFSSTSSDLIRATLFPGDGIGPEIAESVKQVFNAAEVPIEWEEHFVGTEVDPRTQSYLTWESLESVRRNKVGLKGPMATPIGKGHRSLNLTLRKELNLYANVRPCYSLPGYKTRYDDVNLVTIRENTEGEYSGLEHQVSLTRILVVLFLKWAKFNFLLKRVKFKFFLKRVKWLFSNVDNLSKLFNLRFSLLFYRYRFS
ncbi:putative oxidoreductase [Helianthus annuus]|nr:putative oxidoreductase [Helianthus annuus]